MEIHDVLRILCPTPLEFGEFLTKFAPLQPSTINKIGGKTRNSVSPHQKQEICGT